MGGPPMSGSEVPLVSGRIPCDAEGTSGYTPPHSLMEMLGCLILSSNRHTRQGARSRMASIIAHRVLSDLMTIAQSNASVLDRQARMARRIEVFRADITRSRQRPIAIGAIIEKVSTGLEVAVSSRTLRAEQQSVLMGALQTLRGHQSCLTAEAKTPAL